MTIAVRNQMPQTLSPDFVESANGAYDTAKLLERVVVQPLLTPLTPGTDAIVELDGTRLDADQITERLVSSLDENVNPDAESFAKELYERCLLHYQEPPAQLAGEVFAVQATLADGQRLPTPTFVYSATDVIETAAALLVGKGTPDTFFYSVANWIHPQTLGVWFRDKHAFRDYLEWIKAQASTMAHLLPADTTSKLKDLSMWTLDSLTESAALRTDYADGNDDLSFPRVLTSLTRSWVTGQGAGSSGVMPFDLAELICPRSIVFVNVDRHAHATNSEVFDEWNSIKNSIGQPLVVLRNGKIARLDAQARAAKRANAMAANATMNRASGLTKAASIPFRTMPPNTHDLARTMRRVLAKMANVMRSENSYKSVRMSFARPNRRDPDNFNLQGKVVSTRYRPDIHIYLDTSGSISEENYQQAITMLIKMARKLDVNLYFNSFSHYMSAATLLKTKNRSTRATWNQFRRIPKCYGGTDYEQIWEYVNKSKKRRRELSLVITDFEWMPPRHHVRHPRNLYYVPCSKMDWDTILMNATKFVSGMQVHDPDIRSHLLF